ncbi:hypothetical protein M0804_004748 [Polistes exclamans]|nr:hypothetical protein M0804_004748 [Polistes exclamans]
MLNGLRYSSESFHSIDIFNNDSPKTSITLENQQFISSIIKKIYTHSKKDEASDGDSGAGGGGGVGGAGGGDGGPGHKPRSQQQHQQQQQQQPVDIQTT